MSEPKYYPILFTGEMVRAIPENRKRMTRRLVKPQPLSVTEDDSAFERCDTRGGSTMLVGPKYCPSGYRRLRWFHMPARENGLIGCLHNGLKPTPARIRDFDRHNRGFYGDELPRYAECELALICPYGQPGDRLWGRETWRVATAEPGIEGVAYRADFVGNPQAARNVRWRPSIFMPRWASRITLEITGVRVERVQDISEADAVAEGIVEFEGPLYGLPEWKPEERQPTAREAFLHLFYGLRKRAPKTENPWVWVIEFKKLEHNPRQRAGGASRANAGHLI